MHSKHASCDIKSITNENASNPTTNSKSLKNKLKHKRGQKTAHLRRGIGRDVTRDSVIITCDSVVIRNHTKDKSQGHKNPDFS
ncbi:MAG: hypothetical protein CW691_05900 [Candidatus Bathyarchaeum sp.]|nr:MAG: hypothetical protein CW691_05900 [Candidatus Bathyarchaeum sp.]